jgi:hypothetical protein
VLQTPSRDFFVSGDDEKGHMARGAHVSQKYFPAKPDPLYALWAVTAKTAPRMSVACGWYYWRLGFTYGVGLRLPRAMRTARTKMFCLGRGLKSVVVQTKYDSLKVTVFSQNAMFQTRTTSWIVRKFIFFLLETFRFGFFKIFTRSFCLPFS